MRHFVWMAALLFGATTASAEDRDSSWWHGAFIPESSLQNSTEVEACKTPPITYTATHFNYIDATCEIVSQNKLHDLDGIVFHLACEYDDGPSDTQELLLKLDTDGWIFSYPWGERMIRCPLVNNAATGPSFKCSGKLSKAESIICNDPELSALDRKLFGYYGTAEGRAKEATWGIENPKPVIDWFKKNTNEEWQWREKNCDSRDCIQSWYWRRMALLRWLAESEYGFADGISPVQQLENGDTLVTFFMTTHHRNVLYSAATDAYQNLPDGDIKFISESPLLYQVEWQKGYFNEVGAFWFNNLRDADHRILTMSPAKEEDKICMSKDEFIKRSGFEAGRLALVVSDEICVTR